MQISACFLNSKVCTQMWAILIHPGELNCHRNCVDQTWNRKRSGLLVRKNILKIPFSQKHCSIHISRHFSLTLGVSIVLSPLSASGCGSRRCFWVCVHFPLPFPSSSVHTLTRMGLMAPARITRPNLSHAPFEGILFLKPLSREMITIFLLC